MSVGVVHMKPFLTHMTWPLTMNAPSAHGLANVVCVCVVLFSVTAGSQAVLWHCIDCSANSLPVC